MCRLFGFRSRIATPVHRSLVTERNSLRVQSNEHKDGWGIAYYDEHGQPQLRHGLSAAHADPEFERLSEMLASQTVVAHVRLASVGAVKLNNTHPFRHGPWTFAHNGTVRDFAQHREQVEAEIDPALRAQLQGDTDSERCMFLFHTQLAALGGGACLTDVARALARVQEFVRRLADRPGEKPSSTNFLVTDGQRMVATRRNRSLFFSERRPSVGHEHPPPGDGVKLTQLVIASEALCGEDHWHEVPEDELIGVEEDLTLRRWKRADLIG
jgi:predicted glutamine amidotransferase